MAAESGRRLTRLAAVVRKDYAAAQAGAARARLRRPADHDPRPARAAGPTSPRRPRSPRASSSCLSTSSRTPTRSRATSCGSMGEGRSRRAGSSWSAMPSSRSTGSGRRADAIFGHLRGGVRPPGRLALTENFRSVPACSTSSMPCSTTPSPTASRRRARRSRADARPNRDDVAEPPPTSSGRSRLPDDEEAGEARAASAEQRQLDEARCLARRLRTASRTTAGSSSIGRTRTTRPAEPGDVAFLFRAMTDVWPYETALADEGFDYHVVGGSAFYAQQEMHDVVNVLSVIEDPSTR